jgi:hypothetical protein
MIGVVAAGGSKIVGIYSRIGGCELLWDWEGYVELNGKLGPFSSSSSANRTGCGAD